MRVHDKSPFHSRRVANYEKPYDLSNTKHKSYKTLLPSLIVKRSDPVRTIVDQQHAQRCGVGGRGGAGLAHALNGASFVPCHVEVIEAAFRGKALASATKVSTREPNNDDGSNYLA